MLFNLCKHKPHNIYRHIHTKYYIQKLLQGMGFKLFHSLFLSLMRLSYLKFKECSTLSGKRSNLFSLNRDYFQFILSPALAAPLELLFKMLLMLHASYSMCIEESWKYFMCKMFLVRSMCSHSKFYIALKDSAI